MQDSFYCYSYRMHLFLKSMRFRYVSVGVNKNSGQRYWVYEKSPKLDNAIGTYNSLKHSFI